MAATAVDLTDVRVDLVVEMGRRQITLGEARRKRVGDVLALERLCGEAFDLLVNGRVFAVGETVVVGERMALRITGLVDLEVSP